MKAFVGTPLPFSFPFPPCSQRISTHLEVPPRGCVQKVAASLGITVLIVPSSSHIPS